ncbi:MAG: hypothetical protein H7A55_18455 [Verrucomicrobiaceae bacterium]|nr:hypothetical protein [Verrucomicrobiaceae bacterium]
MSAQPRLLIAALFSFAPVALSGAELDFYKDIYPFLKTNCISCHNKTTTKADLNMETPELMLKGGESGPGIVKGKGAESLIVQASLHQHDMEMPPGNNKSGAVDLTPAEVALLRQWIDQGAASSVQQERSVAWQALSASVHPIYSVAMTQDGRYAVCGRSNQLHFYDLATRQWIGQIADPKEKSGGAHRALVQSLAFSPDGKRLASGSFREVKIWRLESSKAQAAATPPASAAVSPDLIKKIETTGKVAVLSSALSADGRQVLTGCTDGSVRVWEAASAKPVADLRGSVELGQQIAALDWTIAAQTLEQAFQKGEVTRIEAQNKALDELLKKATEAIVAMKKVLPEKQKEVKPATDERIAAQKVVDEATAAIAKAPGGKADAALEKELKTAQDKLLTAKTKETSVLAAVNATQSNVTDAEADQKRITDSKAKNAKALATANAAIAAAKKLQDQATADLAKAKSALAKPTAKALAVTFSTDGQRAAAIMDDGALRVWGIASGLAIEKVAVPKAAGATVAAEADGSFTVRQVGGAVVSSNATPHWVLERTLGGATNHSLFTDRVNAVRFSPDGKTLATGGGELSRTGDVILFETASGKPIKTWKDLHTDAVLSLDFSPDGKHLASGGADKIAKVTEIATGKQLNALESHTHHVLGVAFRADGRVLATAGADGVVVSWDMITGERKKVIDGWTKEVTSLQFIGASNQIVTSAGDNLVRIVNDDGVQSRAISKLPDYMQSAASTASGSTIIGGGEDSVLRVWDGTNGKELVVFGAP